MNQCTSAIGRNVHAFTFGAETSVAVRERRRLLARLIDRAVDRASVPEVLAVACGHLRELELSQHVRQVKRFVGLDQDDVSLGEIDGSLLKPGQLQLVAGKVGRLIVKPLLYGQFDLIYAAGLYDYLDDRTAERLTISLYEALKPGGRLLFANFATGILEAGYMDCLMNWQLILRDEADIREITKWVPENNANLRTIFRGNNGAVIYTLITKGS